MQDLEGREPEDRVGVQDVLGNAADFNVHGTTSGESARSITEILADLGMSKNGQEDATESEDDNDVDEQKQASNLTFSQVFSRL